MDVKVDSQVDLKQCPIARCPGRVVLDLVDEDQNFILWAGCCTSCGTDLTLTYSKELS